MGKFDIDEPGIDLEKLEAEVREAVERKRGTRFSDEELERLRNTPLRPRLRREDLPVGLLDEIRARRGRLPEVGPAPESEAFAAQPLPVEDVFATGARGAKGTLLRWVRRLARPLVRTVMNVEWVLHRLASEAVAADSRLHDQLTRRIDRLGGWTGKKLSDLTGTLERRRERDLQLIHNLVFEVTDLRLRAQEAQDRIDELTRALRQLEERERTLEELALEREADG